jgi:Kef-type K+ transport system membrane component KefB
MAGTTLACFALFLALGFGWQASVAFGLAASMSSSAIIMQIFREKGLSKTLAYGARWPFPCFRTSPSFRFWRCCR